MYHLKIVEFHITENCVTCDPQPVDNLFPHVSSFFFRHS